MPELVAAIDVGTTGTRSIIFDIQGRVVKSAYYEYPIITPQPGYVEQDAEQWWYAVTRTLKEVTKSNDINNRDISALVVTNQRETIVPVDKAGEALNNAIVWQDRRSTAQCKTVSDTIGIEKIYNTTGLTIDPYFSASKIMWLKDNKSKIFDKTNKFLLVHDYIVHKLTGEFVTDYSNAARTMLFDINKFNWSEQLSQAMDIPIDKLPAIKSSGTVIGEITMDIAKQTGLKPSTPVVAGGGDQQCAALGLGVIREGLVKATTGTGSFVLAHLDKPKFDKKNRVICSVSVIPNKWVLEASIFTTGAVYRWFRDNFAEAEKKKANELGIDVYELLNKDVQSAEPGARGLYFLPHFAGAGAPYWNPKAKGLLFGLTLAHNKQDVLRAIIEGICFEVKKSLEVFAELGIKISELRISGGATRADVWNQIQADIYSITASKTQYEETSALGAAMIGCVGTNIYTSFDKVVEKMVEITTSFQPNKKLSNFYDSLYTKNKKLYNAINGLEYQLNE